MKQRGILALFLICSAVARVAATSKTARSTETSESESDVLAEADAFLAKGAERQVLLSRLSKAEALAVSERQALRAQQQVLIALEEEQEALASKLNSLEGIARTSSSDGVIMEKGTVTNTAEKTSVVRQQAQPRHQPAFEIASKKVKKVVDAGNSQKKPDRAFLFVVREGEEQFWARYNKAFWEKMIGITTYIVQIFVVAAVYMQFCKHSTIPKLPESQVRTEEFQFGAFDASEGMRDCQMCLCAACCPWIRWADTGSAPHIQFLAFIPALFITALLASAGAVTFGASIPILLLVVVLCRQRIREAYGLPSGNCAVLFGDCLLWLCCPCCAIVQEARQVEYVEIPMQEYGP